MPKKVDHHARRRLIADALLRVASKRGLEAVSLRHVADEAGVSPGMVQHYFKTKDDMMLFALDVVAENVQARLESNDLGPSPSGSDFVRALLVQMLPIDKQRKVEAKVTLAFLAYAAANPSVARAMRANTKQLHELVAMRIAEAQAVGEAPKDIDPVLVATTLLALMEGLGVQVVSGHYGADTALAVFDAYVEAVLTPADPLGS